MSPIPFPFFLTPPFLFLSSLFKWLSKNSVRATRQTMHILLNSSPMKDFQLSIKYDTYLTFATKKKKESKKVKKSSIIFNRKSIG